ncbi:N-(5'-phosphoribosyl)anthranilate isomerase [Clostridia bacterium]|nr:N-(5'-phosphoribosyl)anthranilate isomerase [Clostridia bacterium]
MNTKIVKFCGIKRQKDLYFCGQTEPSHMGFVFAENSKRFIDPNKLVVDLMPCRNLLKNIRKVGVFVNADIPFIVKTTALLNLNVIQLHGDENNDYIASLELAFPNRLLKDPQIWKAFKVTEENLQNIENSIADRILLDGINAGSGIEANWELIKKHRPKRPFILAGGLNIKNIKSAIEELDPDGIDLSSGIETEGFKDLEKMEQIIDIVKSYGWFFAEFEEDDGEY